MTGSTKPKRRMEWSRLLTPSTGAFTATPPGIARVDPISNALTSSAHQVVENSSDEGGTATRFDLGSEGEGGRKAWYVPNEGTVFPLKKGVRYRPREKRVEDIGGEGKTGALEKEVVAEEDLAEVCGDGVLWGITEGEVERAMREGTTGSVSGEYTPPRLRRRRSLEEEVRGIEDEESRRLTAIAYLT